MSYQGDYAVNSVVDFKWNTSGQDGASITRSTDGTLRIYKNNSTTERTSLAGVTQTEDFDGTTGLHHLRIDLSDNTDTGFYVAGSEISVVMAGMVIDTKTVNAEIASFSIERTGGALALIKARLPAALVSGRMDSSVGAMATNVITAASITAASLNGKGDWNIGKTGYALSTAGIQALWDALTSALTTASSIGKLLVDNINATIGSRSTQTSVDAIDTFLDTEVVTVDEMADVLIGPKFTVVADGSNSATSFKISVTGITDNAADWWKRAWASFDLTAALAGQTKAVSAFNQTTEFLTVADGFTATPTAGNTGRFVTR